MKPFGQTYPILVLRSLLFYSSAGLAVVPFLMLWPALWISRDRVYAISDRYLQVQLWLLRVICGVRYEVTGKVHVPSGPVIFASQHESTWETLYFEVLLGRPVMYAKKSIFSYPVFGPVMCKMGHIPVEAGGSADAVRAGFRAGTEALEAGRSLVIFPSGTRRKSRVAELQAGVGVLYQLAGCPVCPVRLNSGACWPHDSFVKQPGTIRVEICPAIEAGLTRRRFMVVLDEALR
ncbi:lysophospholipid acyltransferase family protein [Shimia marina]|uniref:2-acyl-glycerophospho-ethanolamine acyltransferase n=1 Tax=Shimia marina TaxID=321267 RepID=A0A0N7LRS7_9RHOB|nr:lysophospholipid acyltransferase family protein [Shimia marina]CUH51652.1 2-acyl-glycerophospho-ethanolamine acyltransferase [Shimia marina]SFD43830.1 1-acyl-sn-glycerol-3-phosphate acyltransferase [Shimia marina]